MESEQHTNALAISYHLEGSDISYIWYGQIVIITMRYLTYHMMLKPYDFYGRI